MKIYSLNITNFKIDGGVMFGVVPKLLWNKKYPVDEDNLCNFSLRSLLIDTGDRKILIDNGFGDKQSEKFLSHFYLHESNTLENLLAEIGYSTDDITDMVLTHLHYDHCGGGVRKTENGEGYETVFRNAIYWVGKSHWEWAISPNKREIASFLKENIFPMEESGQLCFVENDSELYPGFSVKIFNGHTVGQLIPIISNNRGTMVFMADLIPTIAHISLPYITSYDVLPLETLKEKEEFLNEALENNYTLFFQHDFYNECCTVKRSDKGIVLDEIFGFDDWMRK